MVKGLAGADLSSSQYLFVYRDGTDDERLKLLTSLTDRESFFGVLQNNPADEERGSFVCDGVTLVKAGGILEDGDPITNNASGQAIKAENGAPIRGYYIAGKDNANGTSRDGASGDLVRVKLYQRLSPSDTTKPASYSLTFSAILDGDNESQDATVPGATVGDIAMVNCGSLAAGLICTANVTAANTVRVTVVNTSGGSINPGTDNFHISLIKA
ncbi:MAG: hypothetical protein AAFX99_29675 [Myxococcota bacterium]